MHEMVRYHFGYGDEGEARRGKRLRPQLLVRVALAEGGGVEAALDPAVAVEILHNYSLVHDDIEDGDLLRHGRETVWARYGIAHGINAGDALSALSYLSLLQSEEHPLERRALMARILHEANLAMCEGQGLDISFEGRPSVSMEDYRLMISRKTAALFGAACQLGALAAGTSLERAHAYWSLGHAYGIAFQIRDDALGTWGSTDVTGKPSGADIARRKWTFPVVWGLATPASEDQQVVANAYAGDGALEPSRLEAVVAALGRLGARDAADAEVDRALDFAGRLAREGGLDPDGSIREFLAQGARRVA
jgi:geranylgeranyl diphosphate synthase type I